jgi:cell division protein FtsB
MFNAIIQLFELRNSSKITAFEIQQVSSLADQRAQEVTKLKLENAMLEHKFQTLKDEFYSLESKSTRQVMDAHARLRAERTKVSTLEALQDVDLGQQQLLGTTSASTAMFTTSDVVAKLNIGGGGGGSLSQRLRKATEELHEWQDKCDALEQERDSAVERFEGMKKRMEILGQPQV